MSTKYRISESGSTSTRTARLEDTGISNLPQHITVSGGTERRVARTEGGTSGYPFVPTVRTAVKGAVVEVLNDYGMAKEDDVDSIETRLETVEDQIDGVQDNIEDLPTEDEMESLLQSYLD